MHVLLVRLDGPLMSFGAPIVDSFGVIQELPGLSMLTGLLSNALGYDHSEADSLNRLQERLRYAVCRERAGQKLRDFQTVDFSRGTGDLQVARTVGWTTRGRVEQRAGSSNTIREQHIRYRDYWADARYLLAIRLVPEDEEPTLSTVAAALDEPARPLFIGRKTCVPSRPILVRATEAPSLVRALESEVADTEPSSPVSVFWEEGEATDWDHPYVEFTVTDERDWQTQLHGGQRKMYRSVIRSIAGDSQ